MATTLDINYLNSLQGFKRIDAIKSTCTYVGANILVGSTGYPHDHSEVFENHSGSTAWTTIEDGRLVARTPAGYYFQRYGGRAVILWASLDEPMSWVPISTLSDSTRSSKHR